MDIWTYVTCIVTALVAIVVYFFMENLNYWKRRNVPHEKPHILYGNMKGLRTKIGFGELMAKYYRKFKGTGPFAGLYLGPRPAVLFLDMAVIKRVLITDFSNFSDRGLYYNEKSDPLMANLFFMDGHKWRNMRNILSPTLTSGKLRIMYSTLLQVDEEFLKVIGERIHHDAILDVRDLLARFTIDIIGRVVFGIECNSLRNLNTEFMTLGRKAIDVPRHSEWIINLIESFPNVARKLGMRIIPEDVHQFFMRIVRETLEYREQNHIQANDFMNVLIELKNKTDEDSLSFQEVAAQLFLFFLAGFETSASTMSFALYELALHQDIQERLRTEINEAYGSNSPSEINYDTIMNLRYLNQVLTETIRKYPIGTFIARRALDDYQIPDYPAKYTVEKGTTCIISIWGIHHDPEIYPNPEIFDPERFAPEMIRQRDAIEFLGFGEGPRNCIGMRFGQMQARLGLASLLKCYRFTVCEKTDKQLKFDPLPVPLRTINPIYLKVEAI
ncbi:cytochrome P450 6A1-like [Haematobia irritans]|uniref:cytochrome P450 6A1-like n=1 Tax=Haematobia irritans TaxID=7368 RepID=UPI003F504C1F